MAAVGIVLAVFSALTLALIVAAGAYLLVSTMRERQSERPRSR